MIYEDALKEWGARKLEKVPFLPTGETSIDRATVTVRMEFYAGYDCCGGTNDGCYCSFASSPKAEVIVEGKTIRGLSRYWAMNAEDFIFANVLAEIIDAGGGSIS